MKGPSKEKTQWSVSQPVSVGWMKQFGYFSWLYEHIKYVSGDIVECGLGEGNTFSMLAYLAGREDSVKPRKIFGFDSFEGWPEPNKSDQSPRNPKKGEWKVSEEMIRQRLNDACIVKNFPNLRIIVTKGFLGDTLPRLSYFDIAFLHIDVDLYEGYRDGLKYLWDMVVPGGIVTFDEYQEFPNKPEYGQGTIEKWPGCTKAVNEFLQTAGQGQYLKYHQETKKYYLIKK